MYTKEQLEAAIKEAMERLDNSPLEDGPVGKLEDSTMIQQMVLKVMVTALVTGEPEISLRAAMLLMLELGMEVQAILKLATPVMV